MYKKLIWANTVFLWNRNINTQHFFVASSSICKIEIFALLLSMWLSEDPGDTKLVGKVMSLFEPVPQMEKQQKCIETQTILVIH